MNLPLSIVGAVAPPVASGQAGAFTREQALDAGWSRRQVERRVAAGAWVRLTHRALVSSAATRTAGTDLWAIGLTWPQAVASHWTAAAFHRFPLPHGSTDLHAIVGRGPRSTRWITAPSAPVGTLRRPHDR